MPARSPLAPALALLLAASMAHAAVVLRVDVNDAVDFPDDTAAGQSRYLLTDDTLAVPPFTVDVNPASGAALDDVRRATPADGGALTLAPLFRDCIFAAGDSTTNFYRVGLDAVIAGLTPGRQYALTVWSFDSGSTGARTSDWSVLGLGGPRFAANNYTFDGATLPASDTANRFTVNALADAAGRLTLRGRPAAAGTTAQVFLNGFTMDELAAPVVQATPVLALDFNDRSFPGASYTAAGFSEFLLDGTTATQTTATRAFGPLSVTLAGSGGTVDDRERLGVPGSNGAFTESQLLRDFIFANGAAAGTGLDVTVSGLTPNATYLVELWSYDPSSSGSVRTSDWTVNGAFLWDDYGFNGANLPATNDDYKMAGAFTASASGQMVISGRVVANAPAVFIDALRLSTLAAEPVVDLGHPILSEFLADNSGGVADEDGETNDWIEIWNTTTSTLDLSGWHLTDNATKHTKWTFPAGITLAAQARLLVWASGKNRTSNPAALHTNFALSSSAGAFLGLYQPGGATAVTSFSNLPSQRKNVSYGLSGTVEPLTPGFYLTPTPRAANGPQAPGFVADTQFDLKRGFYNAPFAVHITTTTPGATIFYTTDGSEPTTVSTPYPGPAGIPIATTTALRAKAFASPLAPTNTDTQTYIFNVQVGSQPANPPGWPATWGTDSQVAANNGGNGTVPADYEMDPNVVNNTVAGHGIVEALDALPALSLTLNPADFHSIGTGIYTNPLSRGAAWERATAMEWLNPGGGGFHTGVGLKIHGNSSRTPFRMQKHSFTLAFRSEYGDGKLNEKLFSDTNLSAFDKLILHDFFTDGWGMASWATGRYKPDDSVYFRDPWMRKSFAAMGWLATAGRYIHVYINGLYWGMYEVSERIDDNFCADHLGGAPADWDVIADFTNAADGTITAWNSLFTFINSADLTAQAGYESALAQIDIVNFVDYYLLHAHCDAEDWPQHNGYAIRNRNVAGSKWQFLVWDQEIVLDPTLNLDRLSPSAPNTTTDKTAGRLYQKLRVNPEFRLLFADRAHRHLDNGGALSTAAEQARWQAFADILDLPIVAESARWGDVPDSTAYGNAVPAGRTYTREADWLPSVAVVKNSHIPNLHNPSLGISTIAKLRAQSLYPATEPPEFGQFGGNVPASYALEMSAPTGAIYYTLDGSDPRTAYTGTPRGTPYTAPFTLPQTATVKARAKNGTEWSALTEATFIVGTAASALNLAISELHYHPLLTEDHEFIELMNRSAGTIDLTGVHFTAGIAFTFPQGTLLAAGARILVVRNVEAFTAKYGSGLPVAGAYTGGLDNYGEQIALTAADGSDIFRFTYADKAPWPTAPDTAGRSLVLREPGADPASAANWRSSSTVGGNPGISDRVSFTGAPLADIDSDGIPALLEHVFGASDTDPAVGSLPVPAVEMFDIGAGPQPFLTFSATVALAADDATLTAELSTNLTAWDATPAAILYLGETSVSGDLATLKWRAAAPITPGAPRQFIRLRATLAP